MKRRNPREAAQTALLAHAWARTSRQFAPIERQTFERLHKDERLGQIWEIFEPHFESDVDAGGLINCILFAARRTLEGRAILEKVERGIINWKNARQNAKNLLDLLINRPTSLGLIESRAGELIEPLRNFLEALDIFGVGRRDY